MLNYVITVAISAFFVPDYLSVLWEPLGDSPTDIIFSIVLIGALVGINVIGSQESAKLNTVLAVADLATQVVLVTIGIVLALNPDVLISNVDLGVAPTWGDFALGIALGMIAYTGIETLSNMAEETRDPAKTVPKAVGLVVAAVLTLYLLIPLVALSAMPVTEANGTYSTELGTTYAENPMLGIVDNLGIGAGATDVLRVYVGVLAGIILIIATNAGLIGLSRLTFSMGQYRQLPQALRRLHPRYRTPYLAIIVFGAVGALATVPGEVELLATMYSFGAMLSFTIAHVAVIWLRKRQPDAVRPWKPPLGFRAFGFEVPGTALLGGFATMSAWIVVMALNPRTMLIGTIWMALGLIIYLLYRRQQRLPVTETVKVVTPDSLGVEEIEYQSIVVAFDDRTPFSDDVVATAVRLAGARRRGIHIHSMLTVPNDLPLDAKMRDAEADARSKIERAKLVGGLRVTGHVERIRPGQAGYSIANEAEMIRAAAIVMGMRSRNGKPLYDDTVRTVLAERPCRVIVVSEGNGSLREPIPTTVSPPV
jgi:APA family basic amino acid/polyamine antiporter